MRSIKGRWSYAFVSLAIVFLYCVALVPVSAWAAPESGFDAGLESPDTVFVAGGGSDSTSTVTSADITIISAPEDQTLYVGDSVTWVFEVECSGSVLFTLQRQRSGGSWEELNVSSSGRYAFTATAEDDGARFYWTAKSSSDSVSADVWTVTVLTADDATPTPSPTPSPTPEPDTDPTPTPTPEPDQTPDTEPTPTPTPEITLAPADDATIWDKPFEEYSPTEGLLLILVVLVLLAGTVKLFGRFW